MSDGKFNKFEWMKGVPAFRLAGAQFQVLICIFNWADGNTGKGAVANYERLMDATGLPRRTVTGALAQLRKSGLIVQSVRGGRSGCDEKWASVYDLGVVSESRNLRVESNTLKAEKKLSRGISGNVNEQESGISMSKNTVPQSAETCTPIDPLIDPEIDPLELPSAHAEAQLQNDLKTREHIENPNDVDDPLGRFVFDGKDDRTDEPVLVPDGWHVNGIHVNEAKAFEINAKLIGNVFVKWAEATGERSSSWDRKFGALLEAIGCGLDPDGEGFNNGRGAMYEFAMGKREDWWERVPYNMNGYRAAVESRKEARLVRTGSW